MVSWPSVRSHLTTSLNLRYRPLRCFCSREEQKDSTMMSCSQLHPCVLLLLPVVYSEAAQPAIGRLWSRPHGAPSVSEAWHYTPALRRQTKTRRSIVTVQEEDRRQNTGMRSPTPSDLSLSGPPPPLTPGHGPRAPGGPQPLMQRAQGGFGSHLVFTASSSPSGVVARIAVRFCLPTNDFF